MKRLITLTSITAALITAGMLAALVVAPTASAWSPGNLPPGFSTSHATDVAPGSPCPESYSIFGPGGSGSGPLCTNSPTYQQDFDAFVDAHYTAPSTTAPTTQPGATTTVVVTTTTPADTTTTAAPADTTAPAQPGTPAPATTNVTTVVTTATPLEQSLQAQIDQLAAQLAAVTDRVTRLEKAGDASWLAFQQAVTNGATTAEAAAQARGTYLNAVYQLGDFAPAG